MSSGGAGSNPAPHTEDARHGQVQSSYITEESSYITAGSNPAPLTLEQQVDRVDGGVVREAGVGSDPLERRGARLLSLIGTEEKGAA